MTRGPGEPNAGQISSTPDGSSGMAPIEQAPELLLPWLPEPFASLERGLFRLLQFMTVGSFLLLLLSLAWKMVRRQIGGPAIPDEIETMLFTWMLFIGAAGLVRGWKHIDVPLIPGLLRARHWRLVHRAVIVLVSLLFIWFFYSSAMALIAGSVRRTSPMLRLPQIYWYASMAISAGLMGFYAVLQLVGIGVALVEGRRAARSTSTSKGHI